MKIIDSKGRLLGKISILDLGAALIILLVFIGIFIVPGPSGSIAQVGGGKTDKIEVEVLIRGLMIRDPQALLQEFNTKTNAKIIIRNQPSGQVEIQSAKQLINHVAVPQPDGTVKALPDPRPEVAFSTDMIVRMVGEGRITDDGAVMANQKLKMGTIIEIDGKNYNFRGTVIDVKTPT